MELVISELNSPPVCAPVNASAGMLPSPPHDSGSEWFATPSLYDSFIRNSMPVYPGAFGSPRGNQGPSSYRGWLKPTVRSFAFPCCTLFSPSGLSRQEK